jgi:hypothetical protein
MMSQQLTTVTRPPAMPSDLQTINAHLPTWLQYLAAAYPQAKVSPMTYAVIEDQFSDIAPETMMSAIRAYVRNPDNKFWPSIAELRVSVKAAVDEAELTQIRRAMSQIGIRVKAARERREALFADAYAGQFEPEAFEALAREFDSLGYASNASLVRDKAARYGRI